MMASYHWGLGPNPLGRYLKIQNHTAGYKFTVIFSLLCMERNWSGGFGTNGKLRVEWISSHFIYKLTVKVKQTVCMYVTKF